MTRRDVNEGDVFRKGFATNALEDGATTGQVPAIAVDGQMEFVDAGGGSQSTVKVVDAGVVSASSLVNDGPATLYTPAADEVILGVSIVIVEVYDAGSTAHFGIGGPANGDTPFVTFTGGHNYEDVTQRSGSTDALLAYLGDSFGPELIGTAAGTWQANHAYALGSVLLDSNGHLQFCYQAGTSDVSEPTWSMVGGSTTDGGALWTDANPPPASGQFHIWVLVGMF